MSTVPPYYIPSPFPLTVLLLFLLSFIYSSSDFFPFSSMHPSFHSITPYSMSSPYFPTSLFASHAVPPFPLPAGTQLTSCRGNRGVENRDTGRRVPCGRGMGRGPPPGIIRGILGGGSSPSGLRGREGALLGGGHGGLAQAFVLALYLPSPKLSLPSSLSFPLNLLEKRRSKRSEG